MQRTLQLPRQLSRRAFSLASRHHYSSQSPFNTGPSPPRLPKQEQEVFERLQRESTGAFSTPRSEPQIRPQINQSPDSSPAPMRINQSPDSEGGPEIRFENGNEIKEGEEVHPHIRRGAKPEFEGDVNPKTGEVGGPKNEPLRWGGGGDWSYNGRVTDF